MKKIFKNLKQKNLMILIGSVIIFVAVLILLIIGLMPSKEARMTKELEKLGKEYYTDKWFPENGETFDLSSITETGLRIYLQGLRDIFKERDIMETFTNKGQECDLVNSYIFFFPEEPFGKNDVRIEATLECGFR